MLPTRNRSDRLKLLGLSAGPQALENGRYANMLFGVTAGGDLYAFDTNGRLQQCLPAVRLTINIGPGVTDIDFSTLEGNLWHVSDQRGNDPGHGINASDNGTRAASQVTKASTSVPKRPIKISSQTPPPVRSQCLGSTDNPFAIPTNFPGGAKGDRKQSCQLGWLLSF